MNVAYEWHLGPKIWLSSILRRADCSASSFRDSKLNWCFKVYTGLIICFFFHSDVFSSICIQGHYIELAQGNIFMEQKMRFRLILGRLAILKKKLGPNYDQLLRLVFSCFKGQKNNFNLKKKYYRVCTTKLHKMKVRKPKQIFKI